MYKRIGLVDKDISQCMIAYVYIYIYICMSETRWRLSSGTRSSRNLDCSVLILWPLSNRGAKEVGRMNCRYIGLH